MYEKFVPKRWRLKWPKLTLAPPGPWSPSYNVWNPNNRPSANAAGHDRRLVPVGRYAAHCKEVIIARIDDCTVSG
ncbi:hypothetical protein F5Y13DRAFT_174636 [Hypoxylon sp. FL1857]|nr:hypothetical protein F5Y13DRAFT_174636 [Hypoxylon sp. FL1857]